MCRAAAARCCPLTRLQNCRERCCSAAAGPSSGADIDLAEVDASLFLGEEGLPEDDEIE